MSNATESTCSITGQRFSVSPSELEFCRSNSLPLPSQHPVERLRQMLVFRNRSNLYQASCAFTGERMLSCIPPETGLVVYDVEVWESDRWDGTSYGRAYDFSRPFFQQFHELMRAVPLPNLAVLKSTCENSEYTNGITSAKNCYLVFAASFIEDCMFSKFINRCRSLFDCVLAFDCELCYGCQNISNCYNLRYSENCFTCSDSAFLKDCRSCSHCFQCVNLANKRYCYQNRQLTQIEYERLMAEHDLGSATIVQRSALQFEDHKKNFPVRYLVGRQHELSTGNYLTNTKNCQNSFFINNGEDLEWSVWVDGAKSSFFFSMYGNGSELIYNSQSCGDRAYNLKFCLDCWPGPQDLEYCMFTGYGATHCFGCVGIKKKSYCILNKQYSREEYLALLPRIKEHLRSTGEYGLFFPQSFSPFSYNRSEVTEFFPLPRHQALQLGYAWNDEPALPLESSFQLPEHILEITEEVLTQTLRCEATGKAYRIIPQELEFYRKQRIPLPRVSPFERLRTDALFMEIALPNLARCSECSSELTSSYSSAAHPQPGILCEHCFQNSIV